MNETRINNLTIQDSYLSSQTALVTSGDCPELYINGLYLKNISHSFWSKVISLSTMIKLELNNTVAENIHYISSQDKSDSTLLDI